MSRRVLLTFLGVVSAAGCSNDDLAMDAAMDGGLDSGRDGDAQVQDAPPTGDAATDASDGGPPPPPDPCAEWGHVFPEEAFLVTPDESANLQELLDTHGVIRLVPGDYRTSGPEQVTFSSNQAILSYGGSSFPDVLVAAGTHDARLRGLRRTRVTFEPGAPITDNCFLSLRASRFVVHGASLAGNHLVDLGETPIEVDTTESGYFRDHRVIKNNTHGGGLSLELRGDVTRQSGGNVFLLTDTQTPPGSVFLVEGQEDVTFVGVNAEAYNWRSEAAEPFLFRVTNTGTFRGYHFTGVTRIGDATFPALDLGAERVILHRARTSTSRPQVRLRPEVEALFSWQNGYGAADLDDQAAEGLRLHAQEGSNDLVVRVGDTVLDAPPAEETNDRLHALVSDERPGAPWERTIFGPIPDPTGPGWEGEREGQPDERAALQAQLDESGELNLEARTYYLAGPLVVGRGQRIHGAGADLTALVALDATADLVHVEFGDPDGCSPTTGGFTLAELTLQGGRHGIHSAYAGTQINQAVITHVTFRDMSGAGISVDGAYGWDNNFIDHANFVDCAFGIRQEGQPRPSDSCYAIGEWPTMSYVDKTVFYRNQFLRCGIAISLQPTRANNLDGIVQSSFRSGEGPALVLGNANLSTLVAASEFIDNRADPVIQGPTPVVACHFVADRGTSMIGPLVDVEGSVFLRGTSTIATIFGNIRGSDIRDPRFTPIAHSTSDMPIGAVADSVSVTGLYFDNEVPADEPYSAFMTLLLYQTQGTPTGDDDTREVFTVLTGASRAGSRLLFNSAARR